MDRLPRLEALGNACDGVLGFYNNYKQDIPLWFDNHIHTGGQPLPGGSESEWLYTSTNFVPAEVHHYNYANGYAYGHDTFLCAPGGV